MIPGKLGSSHASRGCFIVSVTGYGLGGAGIIGETGIMHMSLCVPTSTHPIPYIKVEQSVKGKYKGKKKLQVALMKIQHLRRISK